jgi:uncharacterized membrane protein
MIILAIGFIGAFLILIAFIFNQMKKWDQGTFKYDFTNCIGSLLLVIYGVLGRAWPFVVLNGVWFLVSLRDSIKDLNNRKAGI